MSAATDNLKAKGLQVTAQRLAVLEAVYEYPHSTADNISTYVRNSIGSISKQAVYDNLSMLENKGLLRCIQPSGSSAMYEGRIGDNHHHIVCRQCGITKDVDCAVGYTPCLTACTDLGFIIDEAEVIYWGICPQCQS